MTTGYNNMESNKCSSDPLQKRVTVGRIMIEKEDDGKGTSRE